MPEPLYRRGPATLHHADSLDLMAALPPDHVEAIVTDPPYGISFMGRSWDTFTEEHLASRPMRMLPPHLPGRKQLTECPFDSRAVSAGSYDFSRKGMLAFQEWTRKWATLAFRVAAPGARCLVSCGTRTWHRMGCGLEDAGWEIIDTLMWLHGQGFPKARSNLKPAWEPIVLARKPAPHAAPLNIDPCRIAVGGGPNGFRSGTYVHKNQRRSSYDFNDDGDPYRKVQHPAGRWPANLVLTHHPDCRPIGTRRVKSAWSAKGRNKAGIFGKAGGHRIHKHTAADGTETVAAWDCVIGHDAHGTPVHASDSPNRKSKITNRQCSCPVHLLDQQSGHLPGPGNVTPPKSNGGRYNCYGDFGGHTAATSCWGDRNGGPASRFFYTAKAARGERNAGCDHLWWKRNGHGYEPVTHDHWKHLRKRARAHGNIHPTVKPLALMQWLVRLVTPQGGPVLDPFVGSGTTLLACAREGIEAIGIERDPQSCQIAIARLDHALAPQEPAP